MIFPVKRLAGPGLRNLGHGGNGGGAALQRGSCQDRAKARRRTEGPDGEPTVVTRILAGEVDLIVNTPFGSPGQSGPRLDGYRDPYRRGPPRYPVRDHGGLASPAAAVQGIEAIIRGEVGVRSLQEHAAQLRVSRGVSQPRGRSRSGPPC